MDKDPIWGYSIAMRVRLSIAFLLLLILFFFRAIRHSSGEPPPFKWKDTPGVSKSTDTLTLQAQKDPQGPEALLVQAKTLQASGKGAESQAAAQKALELAKAKGDPHAVGQILAFIKLSGDQSTVPQRAAPTVMLTENGQVLNDHPEINAAMKVMTSKSETGTKILKDDFGVQDPARLQTLQQALGDKFIVRTDKTGRLAKEGVEITKGTGADSGKVIMTFDTKTLDENKAQTLAPLVGQALREGALTRDAEGKSFFSRVLTELDGTMHKIWIAVEVRDPGKAFESTTLGKALNYWIWVWEDDFQHKEANSCPNCGDVDPIQKTHQGLQMKEQFWKLRGAPALFQMLSERDGNPDAAISSLPDYQSSSAQTTRRLDAQDYMFRDKHSLPRLPSN